MRLYKIESIEDRWQDLNAEYFKVRTTEGKRYLLRYDQSADQWTLQSGFDGDQLLARPSIELISVGVETIREAERRITGCETRSAAANRLIFLSIGSCGPICHFRVGSLPELSSSDFKENLRGACRWNCDRSDGLLSKSKPGQSGTCARYQYYVQVQRFRGAFSSGKVCRWKSTFATRRFDVLQELCQKSGT
jgi:hypothetical protein